MTEFSALDHLHMAQALRLAERAAYTARPNPMVGCVIAHGSEVVGQGWHQRTGGPHAEVFALREAGDRARVPPPTSPWNLARTTAAPRPARWR